MIDCSHLSACLIGAGPRENDSRVCCNFRRLMVNQDHAGRSLSAGTVTVCLEAGRCPMRATIGACFNFRPSKRRASCTHRFVCVCHLSSPAQEKRQEKRKWKRKRKPITWLLFSAIISRASERANERKPSAYKTQLTAPLDGSAD